MLTGVSGQRPQDSEVAGRVPPEGSNTGGETRLPLPRAPRGGDVGSGGDISSGTPPLFWVRERYAPLPQFGSEQGTSIAPLSIPSAPEQLADEWLTAALRAGGVISDARVVQARVEPVGAGRSFAGQPLRVRLAYDHVEAGAPTSLIAKLPAADPAMRRALSGLRWYESEIRFYEQLAGDAGVRTPRRYYSAMQSDALEYVLLLEEVTTGRVGDQIAGGSLAQARTVVEQAAQLHAHWWQHPRLDHLEWLAVGAVRPVHTADFGERVYARAWPTVRELMAGLLDDARLEQLDVVATLLGATYAQALRASAEPPRTLIHGDCRLDNVFFPDQSSRDRGDEPVHAPTLIDWQLVSSARGPYDLAYFLGTNVTTELRRAHEHELLRNYHAMLMERIAPDRDPGGYSFERCLRDYRLAMLLVFGFWVQTASASTFPPEAHPLRDAALSRLSVALLDLDAAELVVELGVVTTEM